MFILKLLLPNGVTVEVIVVNIVSAGHVFVQQHTHPTYHALRSLDQQMFLCYSQPGTPALPSPAESKKHSLSQPWSPTLHLFLTNLHFVRSPLFLFASWCDLCGSCSGGSVVASTGYLLLQGFQWGGDPIRGLRRLRPSEDWYSSSD